MATKKATLETLENELADIFIGWGSKVEGEIQTAVKAVAVEAKNVIKEHAPARPGGGDYRRSWRVSKDRRASDHEAVYIVHAYRPHYRLTHLLEKGHDVKNQPGGPVIGHADEVLHIIYGEQRAEQLLIPLVEEILRR